MAQKSHEKTLSRIISGLARVLASGDDAILVAIERLLNSDSPTLAAQKPSKGGSRAFEFATEAPSPAFADQLREQLSAFESRDALGKFVSDKYETKTNLIAVLRMLKVPVNKNDMYEALIEKLIDAMIGYKLRSRAIRGEPK